MSKSKVKVEKLENESTSSQVLREILTGSPVRTILSIFVGFAVGAIFMVVFNPEVLKSFGYFFSRPGDTFGAMGKTIGDGYGALFRGAIFNTQADDFTIAIDANNPNFDTRNIPELTYEITVMLKSLKPTTTNNSYYGVNFVKNNTTGEILYKYGQF